MLHSKMITHIFIFAAALALQLLFSARIQSIDVRILRFGSQVSFSKNSPPIAALEDEKLGPLSAEQMNREKVARIGKGFSVAAVKVQKRRIAFLKPLRIQKPQILSRTVRVRELQITRDSLIASLQDFSSSGSVQREEASPLINAKKFVDMLPDELRTRAKKVPELDQWVQSDWTEGTVGKTLDNLIAAAGPPVVPPSVGGFVLQTVTAAATQPNPLSNLVSQVGTQITPALPNLETMVGLIELVELGAMSADQVRVFHRKDGALVRLAELDFSRGEFRIPVSRDMGGELVAELRSETGRVLGTGRMAVVDAFRMKKPILKVRSDGTGTTVAVNSADGFLGASVPVSGVSMSVAGLNTAAMKTNLQGMLSTKAIETGSTFEWLAWKDGFWPSRTSGHADWPNQVLLFPNRMMEAMFGMIGIQKFDKATGIIWGQVKNRGVPLEGAVVKVEDDETSPIYFSGPFPNLRLSGTSSNGYFAFFQMKPGAHQVRTQANGSDLPSKMVEVQASVVTTVDVSTSKALSSQVQTYEGVNGEPVTASVKLTGTHRVATATDGRLNLKFSEGVDPLMLDVFSGPLTLTSRISGDRFQKHQMVPVVKISWLEELLTKVGAVHDVEKSLVVGYIQGKDFEAEVKLNSAFPTSSPIYFDAQGNPLVGSTRGIAGGGFVFTNLPEGFATVVLRGADATAAPFVHRLYLDSRVAGVISKDLGTAGH